MTIILIVAVPVGLFTTLLIVKDILKGTPKIEVRGAVHSVRCFVCGKSNARPNNFCYNCGTKLKGVEQL